ncbi:asparagine--tRNA ligase [candidate division KSB3 bacterium]|uniref:Asparagine--tRNA ligase n=1 Tax=candidate division KSB3 bacterium TaxID=2044937 RepID=A0A9D5JTK3_9BACT|nr:asparagine--tRNA ligase [candidate division KSB3 bacterium]MBD3323963.1 asparagine--tRNA ligase [candidate division KSB3 bacterium]
MEQVYVSNIAKYEGQTVTLRGWLYNKRSSGKLHFLQVRDGTGTIQCVVFKGDVSQDVFDLSGTMTQESSIVVTGVVRADARSPIGYELGVTDLHLVQMAEDYPITPKDHGVAFLMDHRHLWLRSSRQHAILRIRSEIIKACRDYMDDHGFLLVDTPIFTPAACEGTTTLFETAYFDDKVYLTQSGQLYNEATAMAFGKVYCFGPTFRAEKSKTRRHLTEFWMMEPEMAYYDLNDNMALAEDLLEYVVQRILQKRQYELTILERDLSTLKNIKKPFPRITYSEAVDILQQAGMTFTWGDDFGGDEETVISEHFDRPVMIHRYPLECKAFYMKTDPDDPNLALCVDVIAPEGYGEIIGGGQREDDYDTLIDKIDAHNLPREAFEWYIDLRRYGSVPHAGFGLGIERTVAWMCGIHHVRETIPFPRLMGRSTP